MKKSILEDKTNPKVLAILGLGTFLEYFDLMLYTHMSVILTEVFFNNSDPYTLKLNSTYSFLATFALKPVGSLIFGKMGDKIGRQPVLVISMSIMAISCFIIANLPSYSEIGFTASMVILICRLLQGMSVVGESVGAELYVAECISPPERYYKVAFIGFCGVCGMVCSLLLVKTILALEINWRIIFYIGLFISVIGLSTRLHLRESKDYTSCRVVMEKRKHDIKLQNDSILIDFENEKICKKLKLAYFCVFCGWPICFYFSYIYCGDILKTQFNFTKEQVISHNLCLSIINLIALFIWVYLTKTIHPLKITLNKIKILFLLILLLPYLLNNCNSSSSLFFIQSLIIIFGNSTIPAKAIFLMHFPVFKRFSTATWYSSIAHILLYMITSLGLVYIVNIMGNYGVSLLFFVLTFIFTYGILYFIKLEKEDLEYH